jgi:hypothetical protein
MSSLQNSRRLFAISTIIYCFIFGDLSYCLDVIERSAQLSCTSVTTKICDLYTEIVRLIVLVFLSCMLIFIFGYKTIQTIKRSRLNVSPTNVFNKVFDEPIGNLYRLKSI